MENEINVNDSDFNEKVIEASKEKPIVVDFWAEWCMPCRMISPVLEKLAKDYSGKFTLAKIDVDVNPGVSQTYSIMSIPSIKLFRDGAVADEFVGALPEPAVKEWLDKNLIS